MASINNKSGGGLIVSFGEMLIDFVPTESGVSLWEAPGFLKAPGGAPANVAIAVTRLGGNSAFVGKLGDDEFGHMLAGILKENGVCGDGICFDKGARTALAFVTLRADGEREFMFYRNPSADMLFTPEELNLDLIRSAKVFHYGSISLIVEPCRSAHLKAMEVAKDAGALLSYDPNLRLPLWPSAEEAKEQIMSIWEKADVIKVSDVELEFLTGSDKIDDETAMTLWHPNLKLLLVTLGEKGCRYYTKNFRGAVDAFHVKTVDTTGAGDSFVGALLCKIVDDQAILEEELKLRESPSVCKCMWGNYNNQEGSDPCSSHRGRSPQLNPWKMSEYSSSFFLFHISTLVPLLELQNKFCLAIQFLGSIFGVTCVLV